MGTAKTRYRSLAIPALIQPPLSIFREDRAIKSHPAYADAKAGNIDAAIQLVRDLAEPLKALADLFDETTIFVAPHAEESAGDNAIPFCRLFWPSTAPHCSTTKLFRPIVCITPVRMRWNV